MDLDADLARGIQGDGSTAPAAAAGLGGPV
jgi:hypothetical protein